MAEAAPVELKRIGEHVWEIPRRGGMRVPGRVYASQKLMHALRDDPALGQVANVAHLPGIVGHAAMDADEGVVSPGGIGYDVNCGVRLLRTKLDADDVGAALPRVADALF